MADPNLLPASIRDPRALALLELGVEAASVPLDVARIYNLDTALATVLQSLAEQFGVMGTNGWALATTDLERRQIIKEAISISRRKGTPWAVKRALAAVGWPGLLLEERLEEHWALFRVSQALPDKDLTAADVTLLHQVIETWKPARSVLESIKFRLEHEQEGLPDGLYYDGTGHFDGSWYHEGDIYDALATIGVGHNGISQTIPLPYGSVDRTETNRVVVTFTLGTTDFNGLTINTLALYTAAGVEVARFNRNALEKTPDITLDTTWTITYAGGI